MTQVFDANNRIIPVTVVKAGPCVVTQVRTPEKDGYSAVQIAYGAVDPRKVNKPEAGHFAKAGVPPRRYLVEIRTDDAVVVHRRPGDHRRGLRPGRGRQAGRRRRRHQQGQGLRRCHEAPQLQGPRRRPRRAAQAPLARLDRRLRHPGPRLQGHPDGRPHGPRPHHDPEPHGPRRRRRARPAAHQGRGPRSARRHGPRPHRRQGRPREGWCGASDHDRRTDKHARDHRRRPHARTARAGRTVELPAEVFARRSASRRSTRSSWPSWPRPARARTRPRPAARSAAVGASRTARRAPAAPARARPARRSSSAVASSTARSRATTASGPPRR